MLDREKLLSLSVEELVDKLIVSDKEAKEAFSKRDEAKRLATEANEKLSSFETKINTEKKELELSKILKELNVKDKFMKSVIETGELMGVEEEKDIKKKVIEMREQYDEYFVSLEPTIDPAPVGEETQKKTYQEEYKDLIRNK